MIQILKDMGITEYEPRVVNQMLEFTYSTYYLGILYGCSIYEEIGSKMRHFISKIMFFVHSN